ncbi:DMT family transporter [Alkaliphilus peptidifermentans]|uniref:EamA domain-containing membrane protein RarD n=1 Tax=Alkaliphilus peptidifermentans DSM 18978 TaxID=1120976 RepID=A0A1G5FNW3_9FIRM|nr:DMT family transporter [Alkaliphilus peptidifermentans]SCY40500.1 EamA domain-containing membrane protein RarD [Alkaliphilus peptidifermentans DSM 18978]
MNERNKGIFYMILASLFFALMATAVKYSGDLPTIEKVFFRNIVGFIYVAFLIKKSGESFKGTNTRYLIYRSFLGLMGVFLYFFAIDRLPLADAVVLNQTNPFFVMLLASIFLGERIKKVQILLFILALTGVGFIVKPQFDYRVVPALAGLSSALFAASAYTIIRHLRTTDHPNVIVFYFTGLSTITALPFLLFGQFVFPTPLQLLVLLSVGVFATIAQLLMTYAYRYAEAGDLSIYSYGQTVFSIFIGIVIFFEIPDIYSFLGISLIIFSAYLNYRIKRRATEID